MQNDRQDKLKKIYIYNNDTIVAGVVMGPDIKDDRRYSTVCVTPSIQSCLDAAVGGRLSGCWNIDHLHSSCL